MSRSTTPVSLPDLLHHRVHEPDVALVGQQTSIVAAKAGDTTYVMNQFSFEGLLSTIEKYRVTALSMVPSIAVLFAKHPLVARTDLLSLTLVRCGAAPLGRDTHLQAERAISATGATRIQQVYGMSEATLTATLFATGEHDPDVCGVGYLVPNMHAKIVDDDGREVGAEEAGEILLRGPTIFRGYWRNDAATKDAFTDDGWYKTGDIAVMKPSGIIHIVDRKKARTSAQFHLITTYAGLTGAYQSERWVYLCKTNEIT